MARTLAFRAIGRALRLAAAVPGKNRRAKWTKEIERPRSPKAAKFGAGSSNRLGPGLLGILQILSACASDEEERSKAIAEVEVHCGLPAGMLSAIYALRQKQLASTAASQAGKEAELRLIYFGILLTRPIVEKHDCITSFESSNGYRFNFHVKGPFSLGSSTAAKVGEQSGPRRT